MLPLLKGWQGRQQDGGEDGGGEWTQRVRLR